MSQPYETVPLTRDVIGVLIPAGTRVELPQGAEATIVQALGGSYTVRLQGHLFRIEGQDADALGKAPQRAPQLAADASESEIERAAWEQMKTCYDPEIPINIVDLGLIYEFRLEPLEGGGWRARVAMTLTAPGCGMGEILVGDVKSKLLQVPGVREAEVQLVFDPPWTRERMSEEAQLQAGFM
ncbi:MAG: putative Fe-S cluster assembly protein SufT [Sinobacteraceae bacterium]|nr:putative Fe-S cluster assembly protein SufT [Nevskiaceae bacterium]